MVVIRNLQKSYGHFRVLDSLNMNVLDGDVYGFLGKNGCGKSTTMNILCNIISKDGGDVLLGNGNEKIRVGYLPETPQLLDYMNGYEYLRYIASCCNYDGDVEKRIAETLEIVGMTQGGRRRIKGYSRGMNQRLGIASVIFNNPQLLVLDEPTSALDPEGRADVIKIIQHLATTGCTIILCTHILSDVERVASSVGILTNGKITLEGTIANILDKFARREVEVQLFDANEQNVSMIKSLENTDVIDKVDFYDRTGIFVLRTSNPEHATMLLTDKLHEGQVAARRIQTVTDSLEQIYLKAVNGNV